MPWLFRQVILRLAMYLPQVRLRYLGATFGLTSLGKFGVKKVFGPTVCTSTFGVGAVEDRPVAVNGVIRILPITTISLFFDHRLVDGAVAARFFGDVAGLLEGGLRKHLDQEELNILDDSIEVITKKQHRKSA